MDWGDLAHFPFSAEVWGTTAAWVSAVVTGAAFGIAAAVYWRDSNLSRAAQAKLILSRIVGDSVSNDIRVLVENYSSNSIFHAEIELRRKTLWQAVLMDSSQVFMTEPDPSKAAVRAVVDKTAETWTAAPYRKKFAADGSERLKSTDHLEFQVTRVNNFQEVFFLHRCQGERLGSRRSCERPPKAAQGQETTHLAEAHLRLAGSHSSPDTCLQRARYSGESTPSFDWSATDDDGCRGDCGGG